MDIELSIAGPAPRRTHVDSCADRHSPNASALFQAAARIVAETPRSFPLRGKVGFAISSATPLLDFDAYDPATAIAEVLVDAGLLADERQVDREWNLVDSTLEDRYIVVVKPMEDE